jgi:hypothetical protein
MLIVRHMLLFLLLPCLVLPPQSSVWGSGSAGIFCAFMALLTGDFALWQVCVECSPHDSTHNNVAAAASSVAHSWL